ncbi:MAG: 3-phosphoshikimate 1-carboxyvinyltransferase [Bacteroidia bacterium]|nr:3-phosphoshikimate 1-carboxyvinyltransferase [Bacteroidia bacterium]
MKIYQFYPKQLKEVSVTVPCSKSVANRMLILATHCSAKTELKNVTLNTDIQTCLEGLKKLGFEINYDDSNLSLAIQPNSSNLDKEVSINAGPSGTTLRFLTALSLFWASKVHIHGDKSLQKRPIQDLLEVLEHQLGAEVAYHQEKGYLPVTLTRKQNFPKSIHLNVSAEKSSQFASALLMILPCLGVGASVRLIPPVNSYSYIELTLQVMREMGFWVSQTANLTYTYQGRAENNIKKTYFVEGDWSAATFWYGYTALSGKKCILLGLNPNSQQGEKAIQNIMADIGIKSCFNSKNELEIFPAEGPLKPIQADLALLPDAAPMLAVVAAFIKGQSVLKGLQTLAYKETHRIQAIAQELKKIGIEVEHSSDSLRITGGTPKPAVIETYQDHRIAMAFAMAGVRLPYLSVIEPECVQKSYSNFWADYQKTGMLILPREIVI